MVRTEEETKEYYRKYIEENRDKYNKNSLEYYKKNRDKILEKNKTIILCECGVELGLQSLSRHKKVSKKHKKYLENL